MKTGSDTLKRTPSVSPLLGSPIIERDYTKGIEDQFDSGKSPEPEPVAPEPGSTPSPEQAQFSHSADFKPDDTKGFSFEEPIDSDTSDITGDEPGGFDLSTTSAKAFANTAGDLIKAYVPQITYSYAAVDLNSIKMHVANGNMQAGMNDAFTEVNKNTFEALQFEDDEIKMWKKAFKEYLEYKNLQFANPENSFWLATIALFGVQTIKGVQASKQNKQYIRDAIMSFNPGFYEELKVKEEEELDEEETPDEGKTGKKNKKKL
jgi:hypothetical protein